MNYIVTIYSSIEEPNKVVELINDATILNDMDIYGFKLKLGPMLGDGGLMGREKGGRFCILVGSD